MALVSYETWDKYNRDLKLVRDQTYWLLRHKFARYLHLNCLKWVVNAVIRAALLNKCFGTDIQDKSNWNTAFWTNSYALWYDSYVANQTTTLVPLYKPFWLRFASISSKLLGENCVIKWCEIKLQRDDTAVEVSSRLLRKEQYQT